MERMKGGIISRPCVYSQLESGGDFVLCWSLPSVYLAEAWINESYPKSLIWDIWCFDPQRNFCQLLYARLVYISAMSGTQSQQRKAVYEPESSEPVQQSRAQEVFLFAASIAINHRSPANLSTSTSQELIRNMFRLLLCQGNQQGPKLWHSILTRGATFYQHYSF
jgi:hypothetical protein